MESVETDAVVGAELLTQVISDLAGAKDLEAVTGIVASAARALVGSDGATFVLREDGQCFYVDEDAVGPLWKGSRFPLQACISGWAMLNREPAVIPDIRVDPRIPQEAYAPTFVRSLAVVPIRAKDPLGAIGAYWSDLHDADDESVRLLGILANAAAVALENLELRGALGRRSAELDQVQARRDELEVAIHGIAHDLRGPLGAIVGYADLLDGYLEGEQDMGRARVAADTIATVGESMAAQIDRMLALYRVTSRVLLPQDLDLTALAHDVVGTLRARDGAPDVDVVVQRGLRAVVDPVLGQVLLQNLLDNAFKYSSRTPGARVEVGRIGGEYFVRDNGVGFDPNLADRLFTPMTRLHDESEFAGTGLGLASVARIVDRHEGSIRAESTPGHGATFFFTLPGS